MSVAYWSVKLTNGKSVEVQPPEGYVLNVQQATYVGNDHAVIKVHTTSVEGDKLESVIGTLRGKTVEQFSLDLVFGYDVPVAFSVEGKGEVYLNGYYQPGPEEEDENDYDDEFGSEEDSEEGSEDDEDEEEGSEDDDEEQNIKNAEAAIAKLGASRGKDLAVTGKKISKAQAQSDSEEEDDDEDDDEDSEGDSEDERIDQDFVAKMIKRHGLAGDKAPKSAQVEELGSDEEDSEEGSEEEDEDSEEESEEEQPPMKVQKTQPKGVVTQGGNKQQQSKPNTPAGKPQQGANSKPNTPANKPQQNQGQNKTPAGKPQQNGNKTPNTNNKQQQNSGFKSGDKRKR